jgi:hypothetical protein
MHGVNDVLLAVSSAVLVNPTATNANTGILSANSARLSCGLETPRNGKIQRLALRQSQDNAMFISILLENAENHACFVACSISVQK